MVGLQSEPAQPLPSLPVEPLPIGVRPFSGPDLKYELLTSRAFPAIQGLPDSPNIAPIKQESLNLYKRLETNHIIDPQEVDKEKSIPLRNRAIDLCLSELTVASLYNEESFMK